jgi:hypothetical protein
MGITNIVEPKKREWQLLVQKIDRGVTLEDALEQTGIPFDEFEAHLAERMKAGAVDDAMLHVTAGFAIGVGVRILSKIADAGPRYEEIEREGTSSRTMKPLSTDLDAAKALLAFGLKARTMTAVSKLRKEGGATGSVKVQVDLWDSANLGPWKELKDPSAQ